MLRSILVGLDGTAYSRSALEFAVRLAKRADALVAGIGVIDQPTICAPEATPLGAGFYKSASDEVQLELARHQVERLIEQFSLACAQAGVASKPLEDVGLPSEQIMLEAQRFDLIVLGKETHFRFQSRLHADDTLDEVMAQCPRPLCIVPELLPAAESVVVAYDGGMSAARTLQLLVALDLARDRPVHVVSVNAESLEAARTADRAVQFLDGHGVRAAAVPIASTDDPADVILERLAALDAGLLAVGASERGRLSQMVFGSTARSLIERSPTPVMIYH